MADKDNVIQDELKNSTDVDEAEKAELQENVRARIDELGQATVDINGVVFELKEFTNEIAEHCDKWLERNAYADIRIKITKWRGEFEQNNPENYSENKALNEQLKVLQKRLDTLVDAYKEDPTDELDDEMMRVAAKIDEKAKRQSEMYLGRLEPMQRMALTNRELMHEEAALFYEYCYHLGVRLGLEVGEYDAWQEAISEDNLDAARKVVEEGKELTRLTRDLALLKATATPTKTKRSASKRRSANSQKSNAQPSS